MSPLEGHQLLLPYWASPPGSLSPHTLPPGPRTSPLFCQNPVLSYMLFSLPEMPGELLEARSPSLPS